jgi:hypothetical protein
MGFPKMNQDLIMKQQTLWVADDFQEFNGFRDSRPKKQM